MGALVFNKNLGPEDLARIRAGFELETPQELETWTVRVEQLGLELEAPGQRPHEVLVSDD